jgi:hypothetical protein
MLSSTGIKVVVSREERSQVGRHTDVDFQGRWTFDGFVPGR